MVETVAKAVPWGVGGGVVMLCTGIAWDCVGGGWIRSALEGRVLTPRERKRKWI